MVIVETILDRIRVDKTKKDQIRFCIRSVYISLDKIR